VPGHPGLDLIEVGVLFCGVVSAIAVYGGFIDKFPTAL
jgi:hypothetical protein